MPKAAGQTLLREIIHTSQALNPTASGKCIHDKIHRPCKVRRIRAKKRKPLSRQTFTTSSALHIQAVKVVKAVYPRLPVPPEVPPYPAWLLQAAS